MTESVINIKRCEWFDDRFYKILYTDETKIDREDFFPSVTTKLGALAKPFLITWYGDLGTEQAQKKVREAQDKGTRTHYAWDLYLAGGAVVFNPPQAPNYTREELDEIFKKFQGRVIVLEYQDEMYDVMKLQEFCRIMKPRIIASEHTVYSIKGKDAGTLDDIFDIEAGAYMVAGAKPIMIPKGRYVFDLKTGKNIDKTARMQVSRYGVMAEEMGNWGTIDGALIGHTQAQTKSGIEGFNLIYIPREEMLAENQDFLDIAKVWDRNFGSTKPKVRQIPSIIARNGIPEPTPAPALKTPEIGLPAPNTEAVSAPKAKKSAKPALVVADSELKPDDDLPPELQAPAKGGAK